MALETTTVTIHGNLTRDPELRTTSSGGTVVNLTIASTERVYDRQTNQWSDGTPIYLNCSAWDTQGTHLASNIASTLAKGMAVVATGKLNQRNYQDKNGIERTVIELRLSDIGPSLIRASAQVSRNQRPPQQQPYQPQQQAPQPQPFGQNTDADPVEDPWAGGGSMFGAGGYAQSTSETEPEF